MNHSIQPFTPGRACAYHARNQLTFPPSVTQTQPQLSLDPGLYQSVANYNGQYLILMVDPDASTPEQPNRRFILHWLAPNVTQTTTAPGQRQLNPPSSQNPGTGLTDFVSYLPPAPGNTSSAHRYIIYAFQQSPSFFIPGGFLGLAGGQSRANFNLTGFMEAAGLGRPAAAEYFYVSRRPEVPGDFVGSPGATYPGGNGGAVFENSPDAAGNGSGTATATATATSSGATGTAAATGGASGPAARWRVGDGAWGASLIWGLAALL